MFTKQGNHGTFLMINRHVSNANEFSFNSQNISIILMKNIKFVQCRRRHASQIHICDMCLCVCVCVWMKISEGVLGWKKVEVASCDIPSRDDSNQALMVKPQLRSLHKGSSIKVGNTGEEERDKERFRVETGPSNVRRNHTIHSF